MDEYLTVMQAAAELDISPETVRKRLQRGIMQGEHVNARLWMIPRAEVDRWRGVKQLRRGRPPKETTAKQLRRDMVEHQDALDEARRRIRGEPEGDADKEPEE
jgi:excisionase family DNA binding protein